MRVFGGRERAIEQLRLPNIRTRSAAAKTRANDVTTACDSTVSGGAQLHRPTVVMTSTGQRRAAR